MLIDGYVRVSQTRGRQPGRILSPTVQREQIERWARANGATIGLLAEELDVSGARGDRPLYNELISRVETGSSGGVVVASFDRFGRSLVDGLSAIERIQSAGGMFVSIREGLDLRTDTGKLVLRIMFSMAEWELDRVRTRWQVARRRAVARGLHMASRPPAGYVRDREHRLQPDPVAGPVIAALFERRARGASVRDLRAFLRDSSVTTTAAGGLDWAPGAVHSLIANRVYLGELHHGDLVNREAHRPLVDEVIWHAAQNPRVDLDEQRRERPSVLGGLLRCAGCRMIMRSRTEIDRNGARRRIYGCAGQFAAGRCDAPAWISAAVVEPYVDAAFFMLASRRCRTKGRSLARLAEACERARSDTADYRDSPNIRSSLDPARYAEGLAARERREREAYLALAARTASNRARLLAAEGQLTVDWESKTLNQRRAAMAELIECVFVFRRGTAQQRVFVCARGEAPLDLPRRGNRRAQLEPFDPSSYRKVEPAARSRPWATQRIGGQLADFLAEREDARWPLAEEFVLAGRGPLLRQIQGTGGAKRWARVCGADPPREPQWTDTRIRQELATVLAGRSTWPTRPEFVELGLDGLYAVLARRGRRAWARDFGMEYRETGGAAASWTEARIRARLLELCAARRTYPSGGDFDAAGLGGLYRVIDIRYGGHDHWAHELGLLRPRSWSQRTTRPSSAPND